MSIEWREEKTYAKSKFAFCVCESPLLTQVLTRRDLAIVHKHTHILIHRTYVRDLPPVVSTKHVASGWLLLLLPVHICLALTSSKAFVEQTHNVLFERIQTTVYDRYNSLGFRCGRYPSSIIYRFDLFHFAHVQVNWWNVNGFVMKSKLCLIP